jgi:predicted small metal-binding protein
MKTIKCADTVPEGGCEVTVTAESADEAIEKMGAHAAEDHADMMAKATEEDKAKYAENFKGNVWPNTKES